MGTKHVQLRIYISTVISWHNINKSTPRSDSEHHQVVDESKEGTTVEADCGFLSLQRTLELIYDASDYASNIYESARI